MRKVFYSSFVPTAVALKKIFVIKGPGIGDIISSIPLLRTLRAHFPTARIALFNEQSYGTGLELIKGSALYDRVVSFDSRWSLGRKIRFISELRKEKYDIAIAGFPGTWKTALLCFLSGARLRLGFGLSPLAFFYNTKVERVDHSPVESELRLAGRLGCRAIADMSLPLVFRKRLVGKVLTKIKEERIALSVGKDIDHRAWIDSRWAKLVGALSKRFQPIFFGGSDNSARVDKIQRLLRKRIPSLVGKLGLRETAAGIKKCKLFIGVVGGLAWIAAALGVPTIVLSSPFEWKVHGQHVRNIVKPGCNSHAPGSCRCIENIEVSDVLREVNRLI